MKRIILSLLVVVGVATVANAQATRTWVSGVGDDVNPCSRTAPCKTFAGAISKTAPNGVISVLDPGGFGGVTITKGITIDGTGQIAGILSSNTNGVVINATANDEIHLRNLEINGAGTGFDGIRVLQARAVYVENSRIANVTGQGIETPNSSTSIKLFVLNSEIRNTGAQGILLNSTATGNVQLTMENSHVSLSGSNGIEVSGASSTATVFNSVISQNAASGIVVTPTSSTAFLEQTVISHNANGVFSGFGGGTPVIRLSRCMVVANTTNGIAGAGGTVVGFSNNTIVGNAGNNNVNSSVAEQ